MGKNFVKVEIANFAGILKKAKSIPDKGAAAMKDTVSDLKKRAPGWIAQEVTKVYNVKKADVTPAGKGNQIKAGRTAVQYSGKTVEDFAITYKGQLLTPYRFGMTPKAPGAGSYTLKAEIIKGQKKVLGKVKKLTKKQRKDLAKNFTRSGQKRSAQSPIMLMGTGNTRADGVNWIPFQRKTVNRKNIEVIKTLSVPQMVTSSRTNDTIMARINEGAAKRLTHHTERHFKE